MARFIFILCFCVISSISAKTFKFTTKEWRQPGLPPVLPPVKSANEGDSLVISCKTNYPFARVKLLVTSDSSESRFVPAVTKFKKRMIKQGQKFTITKLRKEDEGRYKCVARRRSKSIELFKGALTVQTSVSLKIIPTITPSEKYNTFRVERGSRIDVNCSASAPPGIDTSYLKWYRKSDKGDDVEVVQAKTKNYRLIKDSGELVDIEMLSLEGFQTEDIGMYVCKRQVPDGYITFVEISLFVKGFCYVGGELHATGVNFVSSSCTASCKCEDSNAVSCVSLCPPHYVICPPGQMEVAIPKKVSAKCSCPMKQCVNLTDNCFFQGKLYGKGERFVSKACTSCSCLGLNSVTCVTACPPIKVKCKLNQMEHYEEREHSPGCHCKIPICVNTADVCKMEPEAGPCFALFRRWHYDNVTSTCKRFDYGGCHGNPNRFVKKSICENTCNPKVTTSSKIVKQGDCEFEEKWYRVGESFISHNCKSNCTCTNKKTVECELLCPPPPAPTMCGPEKMLVLKPKEVSDKCFCEEGSCVRNVDVCRMKPEAGSCYAAHRRWYYNPTSSECEKFIYGGCEGNPNNFLSLKECRKTCATRQIHGPTQPNVPKTVTISGKIQLSPGVGKLPSPSCASVKLIDESKEQAYQQASSSTFLVSGIDISEGIDYQLFKTNNDALSSLKSYTLTAVVNVGWCKTKYTTDWIRGNDYVTKQTYNVEIGGEREQYNVDIDVTSV